MKAKTHKIQRKRRTLKKQDTAAPFIEHLYELRRRVFICLLSVGLVSFGAYFIQQHLVDALLWPAGGQQFIYTTVGGGIGFLFKLCMDIGIVVCLPIIAYQILRYLEPVVKFESRRIVIASITCGMLAIAGMAFGYFVGLPAALHFLLHQFTTKQIHALVTIQAYMTFVTAYMFGSALLFQIPPIILFINRIKPLKPQKLIHYERWVIVGAFLASALMNPTPEIVSQLLIAGPIILMYQISILMIWRVNAFRSHSPEVKQLVAQDDQIRADRTKIASQSMPEPLLAAEPLTFSPTKEIPLSDPDSLVYASMEHPTMRRVMS